MRRACWTRCCLPRRCCCLWGRSLGLASARGATGLVQGLSGGTGQPFVIPLSLHLWFWSGLSVLVLYEPVMVACWGATVGKRIVGIQVVRFADGGTPGLLRSFVRVMLPTIAGVLTLGVGWMVVWLVLASSMTSGRRGRGWHDSLAGTTVVRTPIAAADPEMSQGDERLDPRRAVTTAPSLVPTRVMAGLVDVVSAGAPVALSGWIVLAAVKDYGTYWLAERRYTYVEIMLETVLQWAPPVAMLAVVVIVCGPVAAGCWGATAGQRLAGVRAVRVDGAGPVGLGRASLRWSLCAMPLGVGAVALLWAPWLSAEGKPASWGSVLVFAGSCWALWALLHASVLWDPQRRGWRDRLAGTIVVAVRPRAALVRSAIEEERS